MITLSVVMKMDKVYDFSWVLSEIDNSLILKLVSSDGSIGIYQVNDLIMGYNLDKVSVKFANANDLINFINYGAVRFRDVNHPENIIDIPIKKVWRLYLNSNLVGMGDKKKNSLKQLAAIVVCDQEMLKEDAFVYTYKVNKESDELRKLLKLAFNFDYLGMQDMFNALAKINLINYKMDNSNNVKMKRT